VKRVRRALAWLALLTCAWSACIQPPPPPRVAYLRVHATPREATVYENDHFLGTARLLEKQPKELRPGVRYLTFKAPGYFPHDERVELAAGETNITIKLRPIPP
jgi:hypothetical protein